MNDNIKTKKFDRSLKIIKENDYASFEKLAYEKTYGIINSNDDAYERLDVWVPLLYRITMVNNALFICNNFSKYIYPDGVKNLNKYYETINADEILQTNSLFLSFLLKESNINVKKCNYRKKSFFSIMKKGTQINQCLDLLGIEFYIEYSDFFSDKLYNFISQLTSQFKIIKILDFLSDGFGYKYIPIIDIVIQQDDMPLQLKIKCFGFENAELGVNYFEYKEYNIDSICLNDKDRLLKILYLRSLEKDNKGNTITKLLFNEIHNDEYLHLNHSLSNIECERYLNDIYNHSQKRIGHIL